MTNTEHKNQSIESISRHTTTKKSFNAFKPVHSATCAGSPFYVLMVFKRIMKDVCADGIRWDGCITIMI